MLNMSESLNFLKKDFFMGSNYWFVILEHLGNKFQRKINKMARLFLAEPRPSISFKDIFKFKFYKFKYKCSFFKLCWYLSVYQAKNLKFLVSQYTEIENKLQTIALSAQISGLSATVEDISIVLFFEAR